MRLIAEANNNPELFSIQVSCTGHGWDQGVRTPCGLAISVAWILWRKPPKFVIARRPKADVAP